MILFIADLWKDGNDNNRFIIGATMLVQNISM